MRLKLLILICVLFYSCETEQENTWRFYPLSPYELYQASFYPKASTKVNVKNYATVDISGSVSDTVLLDILRLQCAETSGIEHYDFDGTKHEIILLPGNQNRALRFADWVDHGYSYTIKRKMNKDDYLDVDIQFR